MRAPFLVLIMASAVGCSRPKETTRPPERWMKDLRTVAAKAVETEAGFWPDKERGGVLRECVLANEPHLRSGRIPSRS